MQKIKFLVFLSIFSIFNTHAQETELYNAPSVGQVVPKFDINIYANGSTYKQNIEAFRGKVVLLEFWATYCRPCIPAMDHLDELKKQFPGLLEVIAITDEDSYKVQAYLAKRPNNLLIGLDGDKNLNKIFYHQFMPHTVVIDPNGVLKAVTSPDEITKEVIKQIIEGKEVTIKPKAEFAESEELATENKAPEPIKSLFQITLTERREGVPAQINPKEGNEFEFINCTIPAIYKYLYGLNNPNAFEEGRCFDVTEKTKYLLQPEQLHCFTIKVPEALKSKIGEIGIAHLEQLFSIKPQLEVRNRKIYSLLTDQKSTFNTPTKGEYYALKDLLKNLELNNLVELPIINDSGIKDDSLVFVERMPKSIEAVEGTLAKIGFRLQPKTRETSCLILYDSATMASISTSNTFRQEFLPITTSVQAKNESKNK